MASLAADYDVATQHPVAAAPQRNCFDEDGADDDDGSSGAMRATSIASTAAMPPQRE
jgi:hypothetical protein